MKSIIYNILFCMMISMIVASCGSEFTKWDHSAKTDLEDRHLKGKVKEIKKYWNGQLVEIDKYNEYGFLKEEKHYDNGVLSEYVKYKYNEYGKIIQEECKDLNGYIVKYYKYDKYNNVIEVVEDTKEIYRTTNEWGYVLNTKVGKKLISTYKYSYDKFGGLIKEEEFSRLGLPTFSKIFDSDNRVKYTVKYNDNGDLISRTEYKYSGSVTETTYFIEGGEYYKAFEYISDNKGKMLRRIDYLGQETIDYDYSLFSEREIRKRIVRDNPLSMFPSKYKVGDTCSTIYIYTRDEYGSVVKRERVEYGPYENVNDKKEPELLFKASYKYDNQGNIIFENFEHESGQQFAYEITYYQ